MTKTKPIKMLRDGLLSASIWSNQTDEGKTLYSVSFSRSYMKEDEWQNSNSFSGSELLKISRLADQAYTQISLLRSQDALNREAA